MIFITHTDLSYRVIITRGEGEDWPALVAGSLRYDVTEVSVTVIFEGDGTLVAGNVFQEAARRIRQDGTLGAPKTSQYPYSGSWASDTATPGIDAKALELRTAALREAGRMHARLTGQVNAPGAFRETWMAAMRERGLAVTP